MSYEEISKLYNISIRALDSLKFGCYRTFKYLEVLRYSEAFRGYIIFTLKLNLKERTGEIIKVSPLHEVLENNKGVIAC